MTSLHKHLLTLILMISACFGIKAQTTDASYMKEVKIDHPIYVGFLLIDEPTVETMSEVCEYYGLTPEETTDGYTAYRATDGTLLRFKQSDDPTAGVNDNLIEIQTRASQKTLSKILSNLNYIKVNSGKNSSGTTIYDKGSRFVRNKIRCILTSGSPRTLTFRSISNNSF